MPEIAKHRTLVARSPETWERRVSDILSRFFYFFIDAEADERMMHEEDWFDPDGEKQPFQRSHAAAYYLALHVGSELYDRYVIESVLRGEKAMHVEENAYASFSYAMRALGIKGRYQLEITHPRASKIFRLLHRIKSAEAHEIAEIVREIQRRSRLRDDCPNEFALQLSPEVIAEIKSSLLFAVKDNTLYAYIHRPLSN